MRKIFALILILTAPAVFSRCEHDVDPPQVKNVSPAHQAVVDPDATIDVRFSKSMSINKTEKAFGLSAGEKLVNGNFSWKDGNAGFIFTPELPLSNGLYYTITIGRSAKDDNGNTLKTEYLSSFFVGTDLVAPAVIETNPRNMDGTFPLNSSIVITFSEAMDRMSVEKNISITPSIEGYFDWPSDNIVTFSKFPNSESFLQFNTGYTIAIAAGCKDMAGNLMSKKKEIFFIAGDEFEKPHITSLKSDPLSGFDENSNADWALGMNYQVWENVAKNTILHFIFSEPVNRDSFAGALKMYPDAEKSIIWMSDSSCDVHFEQDLTPETRYELRVLKSLKDQTLGSTAGNEMGADFIIYFITNGSGSVRPAASKISVSLAKDNDQNELITMLTAGQTIQAGPESSTLNRYRIIMNFAMPMNRTSIHDNIYINYLTGDKPEISGKIRQIEWAGDSRVIILLSSIKGGNLYKLSLKGGSQGIKSSTGVTAIEDIEYYFTFSAVNN